MNNTGKMNNTGNMNNTGEKNKNRITNRHKHDQINMLWAGRKPRRSITAELLSAVLMLSIVLTGCGNGAAAGTSEESVTLSNESAELTVGIQPDQNFLTTVALQQSAEVYQLAHSDAVDAFGMSDEMKELAAQVQGMSQDQISEVYLLQGEAQVLINLLSDDGTELTDMQKEQLTDKSGWGYLFATSLLGHIYGATALAASSVLSLNSYYYTEPADGMQYIVVLVNQTGYATMTCFAQNASGIMNAVSYPFFTYDQDLVDMIGLSAEQYQLEKVTVDPETLTWDAQTGIEAAAGESGQSNASDESEQAAAITSEELRTVGMAQLNRLHQEQEADLMELYTSDAQVADIAGQMGSITADAVDEIAVLSGEASAAEILSNSTGLSQRGRIALQKKLHWSQSLVMQVNSGYGSSALAAAVSMQLSDAYPMVKNNEYEYIVLLLDYDSEYSLAVAVYATENGILVTQATPITTASYETFADCADELGLEVEVISAE